MPNVISVVEYGLISSAQAGREPMPGTTIVSEAAFQSLRQLAFDAEGVDNLLSYFVQKGGEYVRVRNYVGLLALADGTQLEILPKILFTRALEEEPDQLATIKQTRASLLKMLRRLRQSPFKTFSDAYTNATHLPLWDVFITTFLDAVEPLVQQGIQRTYVSVDNNERFWKGKLQSTRQQRENAYHAERLAVRYDALTADVPPNRILKTTLLHLQERTSNATSLRRIRQLICVLDEVPASESIPNDLLAIQRAGRLFARYSIALRWAEALLGGKGFGVKIGHTPDLSLLFPMQRVFEDYVAHGIRAYWPEKDQVSVQESSAHLVDEHIGGPKFKLRPDILIRHNDRTFIIDTKWKQLQGNEAGATASNYGIDQVDLYQLYAYGKKYAAEDLFLVYPANEGFRQPLPVFSYDPDTRLHVVPFDLAAPLSDEVEKLASYAFR
ncbi:McrC family protein [Spirosoma soli]|uniref:McrC family protein n=1 Tax=Spirosoma soli TaxID=1770529 RepID=A0ABW5LXL8_9BACT